MKDRIHLEFATERRTFLKLLASFTVTACTGLAGCSHAPGIPSGLTFLDEQTYPVIKAFANRILPPGGAFPQGADDIDVVDYFDTVVAAQPPEIQKDMRSGILLLEYRALFFRLSFKRFTEMPADLQDKYLKSWETSSVALFRGIFWGYKKICCLGFFSNEKIRPHIGYDGPWI
ncbi:MAG: gluconate 2-dehydrogenase subunit 3 family protein [Deltaproteobacteria bacterium]|nr:gluconate 2-dehydrogenase subunit 3 family protein [Candidatus Zymogenaceae bacterium]